MKKQNVSTEKIQEDETIKIKQRKQKQQVLTKLVPESISELMDCHELICQGHFPLGLWQQTIIFPLTQFQFVEYACTSGLRVQVQYTCKLYFHLVPSQLNLSLL